MATSEGISFDFAELLTLSADFGDAAIEVIPKSRAALEITARNIKDDWADAADAANPSHARRYGRSVDYDMELDTDGSIAAEIGPNLARAQGSFGFLEDAPGDVAAAPQGNARKALRKNLADFEKGQLKATEGLL